MKIQRSGGHANARPLFRGDVMIRVQGRWIDQTFTSVSFRAAPRHLSVSTEFERGTKNVRFENVTILTGCLIGTEHVQPATEMRKKRDDSLLSNFHHHLFLPRAFVHLEWERVSRISLA